MLCGIDRDSTDWHCFFLLTRQRNLSCDCGISGSQQTVLGLSVFVQKQPVWTASQDRNRIGAVGPAVLQIRRDWRVGVFNQPEISIVHRIAVILEMNDEWFGSFRTSPTRFIFQIQLIVHNYSIVADRDASFADFLPARRKLGTVESNVVGLPSKGRKTHIQIRGLESIE